MSDVKRFSITDITVSDLLRHEPYDKNGNIMLVLASAYDALLREQQEAEHDKANLKASLVTRGDSTGRRIAKLEAERDALQQRLAGAIELLAALDCHPRADYPLSIDKEIKAWLAKVQP